MYNIKFESYVPEPKPAKTAFAIATKQKRIGLASKIIYMLELGAITVSTMVIIPKINPRNAPSIGPNRNAPTTIGLSTNESSTPTPFKADVATVPIYCIAKINATIKAS